MRFHVETQFPSGIYEVAVAWCPQHHFVVSQVSDVRGCHPALPCCVGWFVLAPQLVDSVPGGLQ